MVKEEEIEYYGFKSKALNDRIVAIMKALKTETANVVFENDKLVGVEVATK